MGKVWEIKGLWGDRAGGRGCTEFGEVRTRGTNFSISVPTSLEKCHISRTYGFASICQRGRRRELRGVGDGSSLLGRRW